MQDFIIAFYNINGTMLLTEIRLLSELPYLKFDSIHSQKRPQKFLICINIRLVDYPRRIRQKISQPSLDLFLSQI